jgi:hypothetical protein
MPYYRLYHVRGGHFAGVDDFEADDDVAAVRQAVQLDAAATAELWCGKRKIKSFKPAGRGA